MQSSDQMFVRVLTGQRVQLMAFIWSIVCVPELVEDVYQDVCLVAMEKRPITDTDEDLMRWLRAVAQNEACRPWSDVNEIPGRCSRSFWN